MSKQLPDIDIGALNVDQATKELLGELLNHIEKLWAENHRLRTENQQLKDEVARLKGLKGKPEIKASREKVPESEKKNSKTKQSWVETREQPPRQQRIEIDREETINCDRSQLPSDLRHRGYREVVIQNILFQRNTVLYRDYPTAQQRVILEDEFDRLFSKRPTYQALADRIALTQQKKAQLLLALEFPEVPLNNNEAERALREYVVKRKISNGTRTAEGTRAWEIFLSLADTCRKNGVNFYHYILDRLKKSFCLPSLASLILQHAQSEC